MRVQERLSTRSPRINLQRRPTRNRGAVVAFQSQLTIFQLARRGASHIQLPWLNSAGMGLPNLLLELIVQLCGAHAEEPIQENINNEEDCIDSARRRIPCFHVF